MNIQDGLYSVPRPVDACYRCGGDKRIAIPGFLSVFYETCPLCKGTGKAPLANQGAQHQPVNGSESAK